MKGYWIGCVVVLAAMAARAEFRPGEVWLDTDGKPIQAHSAGILVEKGAYYWYGEDKTHGDRNQRGIGCYRSTDLYHWENMGLALPKEAMPPQFRDGGMVERPKVIFNPRTRRYVMWMHLDDAKYRAASAGIATSEKPTGPFVFQQQLRPIRDDFNYPDDDQARQKQLGGTFRDMNLFVDDDGKAYVFYASEGNATMYVVRLNDEFTGPETPAVLGKTWARLFIGQYREAPAPFKFKERFYLITSGCTGWAPNAASYAVADHILGPWQMKPNPCIGPDAGKTFHAQSTFVLPVAGRPGRFIFMADRWFQDKLEDSRYVWLPLVMKPDSTFSLEWHDRWDWTVFDGSGKGRDMKSPVVSDEKDSVKGAGLRLPPEDLVWWRDAKFGLFITWGLYSIVGKGEWHVFNRQVDYREYKQLTNQFQAAKFNADAWALVARNAGMKYMVMVTRHHDGFALWDSPSSFEHFTSMNSAAHRDFVAEYARACRAAGLRVGVYYSPLDWRFPGFFFPGMYRENAEALRDQTYAQVRELMSRYGQIDVLWYDGGDDRWLGLGGLEWQGGWKTRGFDQPYPGQPLWEPEKLTAIVRQLQPKVVINDRSGWPGDFFSRERDMGDFDNTQPWEKCSTLSGGWGYTAGNTLPRPLKALLHELSHAVCRDGNLLLNVGPRPDGEIEPAQVQRLQEIGAWLKENGRCIYATRGGPLLPTKEFGTAQSADAIYVHIWEWPKDGRIILRGLKQPVTSGSRLTGSAVAVSVNGDQVVVERTAPAAEVPLDVVQLRLKK